MSARTSAVATAVALPEATPDDSRARCAKPRNAPPHNRLDRSHSPADQGELAVDCRGRSRVSPCIICISEKLLITALPTWAARPVQDGEACINEDLCQMIDGRPANVLSDRVWPSALMVPSFVRGR